MGKTVLGEITVEMKGITKVFPGVVANNKVYFEARSGEIHALLGENGAGKTTLMNILYGIYQPDEGEIYIEGRRVEIKSPRDALKHGIGMVHQHFMLIYQHTVTENIALGLREASYFNPAKELKTKVLELSRRYGLKVDPDAKVWQLSAGEQQRVEILKAIIRGAEILILDEPTSVLTPSEVKELFKVLRAMANEGKTIIFITHKLDEVMEISDRVTVLRRGRVVSKVETRRTNEKELARMMVGREILFRVRKKPLKKGKPVLQVENLYALNDKGLMALRNISFNIHEREILGVAGVAGNGQKELVETLTGLRKVLKGRVKIMGRDATNESPRKIYMESVAHIPEERLRMGVVPNLTVAENLILREYHHPPFANGLFLDWRKVREHAEKLIDRYRIVTPSPETPVKLLSGGNIQRLILARETSGKPKLIIAAHPTYGLDVAATEQIRQLLEKQREEGAAILLVSEDLEEIISLSDRVAVMFEGEIVGVVDAKKAKVEEIGLMMAGVRKQSQVQGVEAEN